MKRLFLCLTLLTLSCNKEKTVQLPEIEGAAVTAVNDISSAYLFYNETEKDSIELNRANLISTTNWVVNVDKRLTLEQAIPKIIMLQNKKREAELHKNENSKNYYTCNDTSIKNLGFLDFTKVIYKTNYVLPNISPDFENPKEKRIIIDFRDVGDIKLVSIFKDSIIKKSTLNNLVTDIDALPTDVSFELYLNINDQLKFQDYITFKSVLSKMKNKNITVNENEFIY